MKSLQTYITESMQELYHFTNAYNLIKIINTDSWLASLGDGDDMYISTTRMKTGSTGYPTQLFDDTNIVRVVFDGRKLNSNFKIKPVDKMNGKRFAIKSNWPEGHFDLYKSEIIKQGNVEAEDRVLVKSEEIHNISKYITAIHIDISNIDNEYIKPIEEYCKTHNITFKKYKNTKEFNLGR